MYFFMIARILFSFFVRSSREGMKIWEFLPVRALIMVLKVIIFAY